MRFKYCTVLFISSFLAGTVSAQDQQKIRLTPLSFNCSLSPSGIDRSKVDDRKRYITTDQPSLQLSFPLLRREKARSEYSDGYAADPERIWVNMDGNQVLLTANETEKDNDGLMLAKQITVEVLRRNGMRPEKTIQDLGDLRAYLSFAKLNTEIHKEDGAANLLINIPLYKAGTVIPYKYRGRYTRHSSSGIIQESGICSQYDAPAVEVEQSK